MRASLTALGMFMVMAIGAPAVAKPPKPLFASGETIRLTIAGPVATLARGPADDAKSVAATLTLAGAAPETLAIRLSARGLTRRKREVCSFPPLRVEFVQPPAATSLFTGQKRLKLVTHCRPAEDFQKYVLLEYSAYRLYNLLTPASFAVRLATIDYVDDRGRAITSRLGFFIEDTGDMARRNERREFKTQTIVPVARLNARDAARVALFENMIGNLDWAINAGPAGTDCCHNSRLIIAEGQSADIVPVPYDFDFSGLVDAPYAVPPNSMRLTSVRKRRYRGFCRHNAEAQAGAALLFTQRSALLAVFDQIPQLEEKSRRKALAYVGGFFDQIGNPDDVAKKILTTCLG